MKPNNIDPNEIHELVVDGDPIEGRKWLIKKALTNIEDAVMTDATMRFASSNGTAIGSFAIDCIRIFLRGWKWPNGPEYSNPVGTPPTDKDINAIVPQTVIIKLGRAISKYHNEVDVAEEVKN